MSSTSKRNAFAVVFLGGETPVFSGVLAKAGGRTCFLMANLWWIAGESWEVDGQFRLEKTCHFFRAAGASDYADSQIEFPDT